MDEVHGGRSWVYTQVVETWQKQGRQDLGFLQSKNQ